MAEIDTDVSAGVTHEIREEEIRVCLFSMGEDLYAIPVELLTEIIISQKIFPVPTTPPHVLGVMNLRGNIVPIVDIRAALSLPRRPKVAGWPPAWRATACGDSRDVRAHLFSTAGSSDR